nr:class I SAM-dependent DNA methyltransferase [uncultured Pseudokineococcus sp.]
MTDARRLVDKLWSYCNVLRDDGVGTIEYTEQLTYLLFLKMAHERDERANPFASRDSAPKQRIVPKELSWQTLLDAEGQDLEDTYSRILRELGRERGVLGTVFRKAQNRIQDPAKLRRLVVDLIDKEAWSGTGTDIKGDAYEELLSRGAEDVKSGAGQYFTPRPLIEAVVDCVDPTVTDTVIDPAAGTGGFLLAAHEHVAQAPASRDYTPPQRKHLDETLVFGTELVDGTARLAAMNLLLHGIGKLGGKSPVDVRDSLIAPPSRRATVVLSNPPFGRKSSLTMVGADGREVREDREIERQDFVATTSNKQLNFVQHIMSLLEIDGRAAVVLPDNVLFEGGAGEVLRRRLVRDFDLHTMLRLPTGIRRAGRQGERALLRQAAGAQRRAAVDRAAVGLRPADQPALHAQAEPAAAPPRRLRRVLQARTTAGGARGERALPLLRPRRARGARQGQPRHHLAARRLARGPRRAARARGHRPRDRRGPHRGAGRVRGGGSGSRGVGGRARGPVTCR